MSESHCARCSLRARHDRNPRSLIGRLWRWHINFCPGWKAYLKSLSTDEQDRIRAHYALPKPR